MTRSDLIAALRTLERQRAETLEVWRTVINADREVIGRVFVARVRLADLTLKEKIDV